MTGSKDASANKLFNDSSKSENNVTREEEQKTRRYKKLGKDVKKKKPARNDGVVARDKPSKHEVKHSKRKKISNEINTNISGLRQTSLKESFTRQARIIGLRSRKSVENSKEESVLISEHLPPERRNSVVVVARLSGRKRKVPVYKCVSPEASPKDTSEVYEFKFDVNDSKEGLPKKRKRRRIIKKTLVRKKKKIILQNQNAQKTEVDRNGPIDSESEKKNDENPSKSSEIHQEGSVNVESEENKENKQEEKHSQILQEESKENREKKEVEKNLHMVQEDAVNTEPAETKENSLLEFRQEDNVSVESAVEKTVNSNKEKLSEQSVLETAESSNEEETAGKAITKPVIISVKDLSNRRITVMDNSRISSWKDLNPLKPTNIKIQHKNTINNSLFEKSLSPIPKSSENYSLNSPWRPPPLLTFSQVRSVFQSTPQSKQYEIIGKRFSRSSKKESRNYESTTKVKDTVRKNDENISMEGHVNTGIFRKRKPTIARKFGTEITNLDHSVRSNLMEDLENIPPNAQSIVINPNANDDSKPDSTESKENSVPSYKSPKEVAKKGFSGVEMIGPRKHATSIRSEEQKENSDPRPGPSGLQRNKVFDESRVLRQSNLNNFLNITETPQNTTIKTPHGIFNDVHSAPVSGKASTKPTTESDMELKNAFGFDDDSSENVSPMEHEITNDEKDYEKPFARISVGELKKKLIRKKPVETVKKEEGGAKSKKTEARKSPAKSRQNYRVDIANFSNTFDVLSDMGDSTVENTSHPALFADLEPSYFTQVVIPIISNNN